MKSSSSIIKSSNLIVSRTREVQHRFETVFEETSQTQLAVEVLTESNSSRLSEEDARSIIEETEDIVKQLLSKAEQQASSIVQEAKEKAQEIMEQARREGEQIKQASEQMGYAEGEALLKRKMEDVRQSSIQESERLLAQARLEREQMLEAVEPQVLDLVMKISRKVIGRQLDLHPDTVKDITREALERAKGIDQLVVKVHESSYEPLSSGWVEAVPDPELARRSRIEVDNLVEPGGCVIETSAGLIDSQISTQLNAINDALEQVNKSGS